MSILNWQEEGVLKRTIIFLNYLKFFVLSIFILFVGLLLFPIFGAVLLSSVFEVINKDLMYMLAIVGPFSLYGWLILIALLVAFVWPFFAFIIWVIKDSKKFKAKGIQTSPFLWGVGMIFPLILVVFPLYFVYRNTVWLKEKKKY